MGGKRPFAIHVSGTYTEKPYFPYRFAAMSALPLPVTSVVFVLLFTLGAALGYKWRDNTAKLAESQQAQRYTQMLNEALDKARRQEQTLYAQMEALTRDTEKQLEAVAAAERAAADTRLHELAKQYAHRPTGTNPPIAASCEAERTRAAVLAKLLGEADAMAGDYAAEADRNRLAGLACERAYEAAREGQK